MTQNKNRKNDEKKWIVFILVALFIVSCTVQRRHYLPGLYVDLRSFAHGHKDLHSNRLDTLDVQRSLIASDAGVENEQPKIQPAEPNPGIVPGERITVLEENSKDIHPALIEPSQNAVPTAKKNIQKKQDLISASKEETSGDQYLYLIAAGMMVSALSIMALFRKFFLNITRWAKENPKKTQVLITTTGFTMMGLALYSGYNLKQMGYDISGEASWISSILVALGFLFVPFRIKRDTVAHPKTVNRRRLVHAGIIASSFVLVMAYGNRMEEQHPNSPVTKFITAIDNTAFPDTHHDVKTDSSGDDQKPQIQRAAAGTGVILVAILLFILLLATLCASICLIIFAMAGAFTAGAAILAVVGGLAGSALSIFGMVSVVKWTQKKDREGEKTNRLDNID
jgi:hypothetical protein